ncbi:MAG: leucyl aminopeptidase family protein [Actinomycetota bacterium]|nr:leucyl aminopeptidase family protein [Actinomycetota bacterium]
MTALARLTQRPNLRLLAAASYQRGPAFSKAAQHPETGAELLDVRFLTTADLGSQPLDSTQRRLLTVAGFDASVGAVAAWVDQAGGAGIALGLGPRHAVDLDTVRRAGAALAAGPADLTDGLLLDVTRDLGGLIDQAGLAGVVQAFVEGLELGRYRVPRLTSAAPSGVEVAPRDACDVVLAAGQLGFAERGQALAVAVNLVRDLINLPGGLLGPALFTELAAEYATRLPAGIEVRIRAVEELVAEGFGGLAGVGQAATEPPLLLELRYRPALASKTVALVGKGITFDSGGLNLKSGPAMLGMKNDMAGAATVLAVLGCLAERKLAINVTAILPIAENAIGPAALRPGDVVFCRDGTSVEVTDTDCEGRLVLADGLALAVEQQPELVIDVGTLTGSSQVALGPMIGAVFSNRAALAAELCQVSQRVGETMWSLPLAQQYAGRLESQVAELRNTDGDRLGGAIFAALFLQRFVGDTPWLHLDVDGPAYVAERHPYGPAGGTGYGVRTLVDLLEAWSAG